MRDFSGEIWLTGLDMAAYRVLFVVAGLGLSLLLGLAKPASAEFFGCNDQRAPRVISYSTHTYSARAYTPRSYSSRAFAAQRRSATVYHRSNDPFAFLRDSRRR